MLMECTAAHWASVVREDRVLDDQWKRFMQSPFLGAVQVAAVPDDPTAVPEAREDADDVAWVSVDKLGTKLGMVVGANVAGTPVSNAVIVSKRDATDGMQWRVCQCSQNMSQKAHRAS